ncbi:MAG: dTMP kinase [Candidatus Omnitrophica bacterium]|nr:dTMP kinase [Candidatus Omnitrophota bacterium]MDD5574007.1 dTMP kinase [Candidatus Omnitrophota bacterium]
MSRGIFITFEGPEKSGKSTQARLLEKYLKSKGWKTLFIREPGSTVIGEKIRRVLLDRKNDGMSLVAEMLLYTASRAQLVEEVIRPALRRGMIVLCDRFQDSTLAYQGYGCGLDVAVLEKVGKLATSGITPDLTLLLDFWQSRDKLKNESAPDRIELRPDAFHQRVKKGYFVLAGRYPQRIKIVRVEPGIQETQAKIREIVESCLLKKSSDKKRPSRS